MAEVIAELTKFLPENDWMRLALLVFALLLLVLREKLFIVIGRGCRYLYRWVKCRFGRHTWISTGVGQLNPNTLITGKFIYRCSVCLRQEVFDGTL